MAALGLAVVGCLLLFDFSLRSSAASLGSAASRWGHDRKLGSGHSTSPFAIRRDRYVQRAIYVEVDFTAFVSKITRGAILTRVEVRERGQVRIRRVGPALGYLGIHRGL